MGLLDSYPIRKLLEFERKLSSHPNQFVLMRFLGIIFAIRNDTYAGVPFRTVWQCYRCVLLFTFGTYCYKVYWAVTHWVYSPSATRALATTWIAAGALVRVLIWDRPVQTRLVRFLNDRTYRAREPEIVAGRHRLQRLNNRLMAVVVVCVLSEILWFVGTKASAQPEFMLQYRGRAVGGRAVQVVHLCTTCCGTVVYIVVSVFVYVLLNVFRHEMTILVQSFANIGKCFERYRLHSLDVAPIAQNTALGGQFFVELQTQLNDCIKRHVELLENLYDFCSILAPFCFVQYYGTFMLIGVSCAIAVFSGVSWLLLVTVVFIGFLVLESLLLYRSIDILNELHLSVATTLYNLNWHDGLRHSKRFAPNYRQVRQCLLIVMLRAQTPLRLRITGYGTLTMNRFAELINNSYSLFTILLQLRAPTESK